MQLCVAHSALSPTEPPVVLKAARTWGFDGVLLTGAYGLLDVPGAGAWQRPWPGTCPDSAKVVGLHAGVSFQHQSRPSERGERKRVQNVIERASAFGAELVVMSGGRVRGLKMNALQENAQMLGELAVEAGRGHVRLAFENAGDLSATGDLWYLCDAAGHPAVRACLNVTAARQAGETVSLATPRLGAYLALVHFAQVRRSAENAIACGDVSWDELEVPRLIDVLKGLAFRGWLLISPADGLDDDARASVAMAAAERLRAELAKPVVELSAYKGDKNAPRFPKLPSSKGASVRPAASAAKASTS